MRNDYLDYLRHEGRSKLDGAPRGSGRYPLGSGKEPYQMFDGSKYNIKSLEEQYRESQGIPASASQEEIALWKARQSRRYMAEQEKQQAEEYTKDLNRRVQTLNSEKRLMELEKETDPERIAKKEYEASITKAEELRNKNAASAQNVTRGVQDLTKILRDRAAQSRNYATSVKKGQKQFEKALKNMSDEELSAAINRANQENRLREATGYSNNTVKRGYEKTQRLLETVGMLAAITGTVIGIRANVLNMKARNN